ncbi:hypothetical protein J3E73DRAFT_395629 [Bipolaris maydis]|nr:hypothetical protein J3E73DRAFT_395629 [Bipolaris maydis]
MQLYSNRCTDDLSQSQDLARLTRPYWAPPGFQPHHFQLHTTLKPAQIQLVQCHEDHGIVRIAAVNPISQASSAKSLITSRHPHTIICFSILVFGDESGNLVPEGCSLLWKWAKEQSQYRKSGVWDHRLAQVLVDAEWTAGKDVAILAKGVDEEEYERVAKGAIKS